MSPPPLPTYTEKHDPCTQSHDSPFIANTLPYTNSERIPKLLKCPKEVKDYLIWDSSLLFSLPNVIWACHFILSTIKKKKKALKKLFPKIILRKFKNFTFCHMIKITWFRLSSHWRGSKIQDLFIVFVCMRQLGEVSGSVSHPNPVKGGHSHAGGWPRPSGIHPQSSLISSNKLSFHDYYL